MSSLARAVEIAAKVHAEQTDKGGEEYILHALEVMRKAGEACIGLAFDTPGFKQKVMIVGVLHDAVEDFKGRPGDKVLLKHMIQHDFGKEVADAIDALTHDKKGADMGDGSYRIPLTYEEYIDRVARNPIARIVKIADLTHNMDTGRLPEGDIEEKDFERWDKYRRALVKLKKGT